MSVERWLIGAACVAMSGAAFANVELVDLYRQARARDPQLEAARWQRAMSVEKLPQAQAGWRPVVQITANTLRQQGQSSFVGSPLEDRSTRSGAWNLQLTQPLWRPAQSAATSQAEVLVRQADEQLTAAEQDLVLRVAQAYFDTVVAQESLRVAHALVIAVVKQLEVAQRNFEVGMVTITDVHESRSRHALARAQWFAAQTELDMRAAELERLTGRRPEDLRRPMPQTGGEAYARQGGVDADVMIHPQLKALVMGVEAAALEVRKQQAAHGPTLDATAGYGHNFSSGSMTSPTEVQSRSRAAQVGLQFNLPLYEGGVVASRVREAMAQRERAEAELAMLHGQLLMQVSQYQQAWLRSRDQIQALAEAVEASHALVEASLIGYRIGTRINLDVLNAEQQRAGAERDVFKACADAAMYRLRLKAAQGQLGVDDLTQVDEILKVE